jgi:hypothetical protein
VDPELASVVGETRGRVLEYQAYRIAPADQDAFLALMVEVRDIRGRVGAEDWQLYEDVAHADGWMEVWTVDTWTEHLREAVRMDNADRAVLAQVMALHQGEPIAPCRFISVSPHRLPAPLAREAGG